MLRDVTICLTSVPPRFAQLDRILGGLLDQGAFGVTLVVPGRYRRFPDWTGDLPALPRGVEVLRGPDFGPASKFLTPARATPDTALLICDDDCLYAPGWAAGFATHWQRGRVVAASSFAVSRICPGASGTIVQGFGGVMFHPADMPATFANMPAAFDMVDDVWLSAMAAQAGLEVITAPSLRDLVTPLDLDAGLQDTTARGDLNRQAVKFAKESLGVWR